jgi:prepilin-type N-terminal cleavage/methylation domain-containing protein
MISLKKRQSGFTIVELLIVIVVIGILATLVIVTFTGIQQKARDSQRQTDINAVNSQLEAFYAQNGYYPSLADLQDQGTGGFVSTSLKGLDVESLKDPKSGTIAATSSSTAYGYATQGCITTSASSSSNQCTGYTLTATLESGGTFSKKSNT